MKTQPLSIDAATLEDSKKAAEVAGLSWSAYAAKAIRRQVVRDNLRRAAELDRSRKPEETASIHAWRSARIAAMVQRWDAAVPHR